MTGTAVIERDVFSFVADDAVDAATIGIPARSGWSEDDTQPLPGIKVARPGEPGGGNAVTRVEDIQRRVRCLACAWSWRRHAQQHVIDTSVFQNPRILYTFQTERPGGEESPRCGRIESTRIRILHHGH